MLRIRIRVPGGTATVRRVGPSPQGLEQKVIFALDEPSATITERVRETIED